MLLLVGDTRATKLVSWLQERGYGRIWIDKKPKPYPLEPWGFDNGAFRDWLRGQAFDADAYLRRLDKAYVVQDRPYLAVVPDLVAQGLHSLEFSLSWLDRLPRDWPWYLAVQDGMGLEDVEGVIHHFAGLFLGGSNRFKLTAWHWSRLAHAHGKIFHYGRAGTPKKIWHAMDAGSNSCDSAFPLWVIGRLEGIERALTGSRQLSLLGVEAMAVMPWRDGK